MKTAAFSGKRIAVFGLGRSGLAVGKAAMAAGAEVVIYDQSPADAIAKPELLTEAKDLGLTVISNWDGQTFLDEPDCLVSNPAVRKDHPTLLAAAERMEVIGEIEFAYRLSEAPILAITGSNGKSTSTVMLYHVLKSVGVDAVLCGNIFGSGYPEVPLTEACADASPNQVLVAEISSFQLEWVREFRPRVAAITNIVQDHLDRYTSFRDYASTKQRIFSAQTETDTAVIRAHDPVVTPPRGPKLLRFGATAEEARLEDGQLILFGEAFSTEKWIRRETHNIANAALALLMAYAYLKSSEHPLVSTALQSRVAKFESARNVFSGRAEAPKEAIPRELVEAMATFSGLRYRMEDVGAKGGVRVINNSMCTNPDAVVKSVQSVRDSVHILLGGINKDTDFRPVAALLANGRHRGYLFGRDKAEINEQLGGLAETFETMEEAFRAAAWKAVSGEVIMLAPGCASSDQFRDFRHRGDVFTELAKEWLENAT